jgi:acyl-CoA synthetase (AMP-forming)/AMP-acid ligase II
MDLTTMLESSARRYPGKVAIVYGAQEITYAELLSASKRAANILRARGAEPGDRVAVMTITGGENVYSQEVEEAIRPRADVRDVAVIGRPHPEWGETVVAVVAPAEGAELDVAELRAYLSDKLARYKIPRELVLVDELPRNPSGKLTKHVLRKALVGG